MGKFVVIEGLDGCGKSTQIQLLAKCLRHKEVKFKYLHFPRTDLPVYGELISRYLRGEFGEINSVHPYLVALLYAGDRANAKGLIKRWLRQSYTVIIDRYVYSNIAFQCAKVKNHSERKKLKEWILHLEYTYNRIPSPDLSLFLHVPLTFISDRLAGQRDGSARLYLNGARDIHEASIDLQKKVEQEYLDLVKNSSSFLNVECASKDGAMLSSDKIHDKIVQALKTIGII